MVAKRLLVFSVLTAICLVLAACNYPVRKAPTPFPFPTPAQTAIVTLGTPATQVAPEITVIPITPAGIGTSAPPNTGSATVTQTQGTSVTTHRPDGHLVARALSTPPTIDGNLDDWKQGFFPIDNVVYGANEWTGASDCSGTVMIGWDSNALYLAGHVYDDVYVQNVSGSGLYLGDSLEVLFDNNLRGDYYTPLLDGDDYQLGFSPGSPKVGDNPNAYRWFPTSQKGNLPDVQAAYRSTGDGYDYEIAIPWSTFGIQPVAGKIYGFAFSISDNDQPGKDIQQTMVSTAPRRFLPNPTTWGDIELEKP